MPGRHYTTGTAALEYRYGFNGMEKDDEVNGKGNSYDFNARILDPRLGRWLSLDPLAHKYPGISPYNAMGNNPVLFVDPNGKEIVIYYGNNQSYTVGSKQAIPKDEYVQAVLVSLTAIRAHEPSAQKLNDLVSDKTFTVRITNGGLDNFSPKTSGGENPVFYRISDVTWNSNLGLVDKENGEKLSPFIALFHELGHAHRYRNDLNKGKPKNFVERIDNQDNTWRNQEERENIATNEHPLANFYNQIQRRNYSQDYKMTEGFNGPLDDGNGRDVTQIPLMTMRQPESSIEMEIIKK